MLGLCDVRLQLTPKRSRLRTSSGRSPSEAVWSRTSLGWHFAFLAVPCPRLVCVPVPRSCSFLDYVLSWSWLRVRPLSLLPLVKPILNPSQWFSVAHDFLKHASVATNGINRGETGTGTRAIQSPITTRTVGQSNAPQHHTSRTLHSREQLAQCSCRLTERVVRGRTGTRRERAGLCGETWPWAAHGSATEACRCPHITMRKRPQGASWLQRLHTWARCERGGATKSSSRGTEASGSAEACRRRTEATGRTESCRRRTKACRRSSAKAPRSNAKAGCWRTKPWRTEAWRAEADRGAWRDWRWVHHRLTRCRGLVGLQKTTEQCVKGQYLTHRLRNPPARTII